MIKLKGQKCVIVGGGKIAYRRTMTLLAEGARIVIVSPELRPELAALVEQKRVGWLPRAFEKQDVHDTFLVVAATNKREVNEAVAHSCSANQLINIADDPGNSSFYFPAVGKRGLLTVAVGTEGASPILAKNIRDEIMSQFDESYESYISFVKISREKILSLRVGEVEKRQLLTEIVDKKYLDAGLQKAFLEQLNK
ncbi:NAD(P)-binding protein [Lysinibacillus sp. 3P01SB]|uniref:NAD(P)-binding protein n=1 Tax=Lysinibacillus sp. 3P01SB TaxID=3132284 RepID=UPI0039A40DCF